MKNKKSTAMISGLISACVLACAPIAGMSASAADIVYGDANGNGTVEIADAVLIMQSLSNPSKFQISEQGKANADCSNVGDGITNGDALAIQKFMLGLISSLPENK